ncbi:MAG: peptidoglycan-binding domain-containing protein [Patescibacteria group bacterium]
MSTRTVSLGALLIAGALVLAANFTPLILTAQVSGLVSTTTSGEDPNYWTPERMQSARAAEMPAAHTCTRLTRNLYFGLNDAQTGGQVSALQRFLTQTGDFTYGTITGYFGPATEQAVERFQCREMQLCDGSPETNGYGAVGPRTRAAINARCTNSFIPYNGSGAPGSVLEEGSPPNTGPSVIDANPPVCTEEYQPVCGIPPGCKSCAEMGYTGVCPQVCMLRNPQTYANACKLRAAGATLLYNGACTASTPPPTPPPPYGASCITPWGTILAHGQSVTAYDNAVQLQSSPPQVRCSSEIRTCTNGVLSGSYRYASCGGGSGSTGGISCTTPWGGQVIASGGSVSSQPYFSGGMYTGSTVPLMRCDNGAWLTCDSQGNNCYGGGSAGPTQPGSNSCTTPWGATLMSGQSVTAYQLMELQTYPPQQRCASETRYCVNGTLSGSYLLASCSVSTSGTYSQLANALTAVGEALKGILNFLTQ